MNVFNLGAHVSIAGSITNAPERAHLMGCRCFQIFNTSPRSWRQIRIPQSDQARFRHLTQKYKLGPVFIHTIYLTNLASSTVQFWELSIQTVIDALFVGKELGARAIVTHIGSPKEDGYRAGLERVHEALRRILTTVPKGGDYPQLCLEFSAGTGAHIGKSFAELKTLLDPFGDHRLGIVLDTAHMFSSGVELRSKESLEAMVGQLEQTVGLDKVGFIHLNDSKVDLNGGADRHEDIGKGKIGLEALRRFVHHPKLHAIPMVLETPGLKTASADSSYLDGVRKLLE